MGNTNADWRGFPFSCHMCEAPWASTGSEPSTSNQCAWWHAQAAGSGTPWFLMSVRPVFIALSPLWPLSAAPSVFHTTPSLPLRTFGDGSEWHGLSRHTGAALWIISFCGTKTQRWEGGTKRILFSPFPPLSGTMESSYSLLCFVLLFC